MKMFVVESGYAFKMDYVIKRYLRPTTKALEGSSNNEHLFPEIHQRQPFQFDMLPAIYVRLSAAGA